MKIVSLTAISSRFAGFTPTLKSLLAQGADPVQLHIPRSYRRLPDWDGNLAKVPAGISIVRCDTDFGPPPRCCLRHGTCADKARKFCFVTMIASCRLASRPFGLPVSPYSADFGSHVAAEGPAAWGV
jgi:hypothetical protein